MAKHVLLTSVAVAGMLMAPAVATIDPAVPPEALSVAGVIQMLAHQGYDDLRRIDYRDSAFHAVVRDDRGRLVYMSIDAYEGGKRFLGDGGYYRNAVDPALVNKVKSRLTPVLPPNSLAAHEVSEKLMTSGDYLDLRSLRIEKGAYEVEMVALDGSPVRLVVDPVHGTAYRPRR